MIHGARCVSRYILASLIINNVMYMLCAHFTVEFPFYRVDNKTIVLLLTFSLKIVIIRTLKIKQINSKDDNITELASANLKY